MKNILFILSLVIWCSCSSEIPFDTNRAEDMTVTRTTNSDSVYYFEGYFSQLQPIVTLPYKKDSIRQTIVSYRQVGATAADIVPEVVSKPTWVNRIDFLNPYYKIYEVFISVDANTSVEKRVGSIILKQPESNKTLNIGITQNGINNYIIVSVKELYSNHPLFTATTTYPVEKEINCRIPYEAYNDGGKYDGNASITIPKGETKGTYEMDYNGSPLVYYHGDIKAYKLYEGTITGDDIYTYSFARYW
jgi:hypothetical protein